MNIASSGDLPGNFEIKTTKNIQGTLIASARITKLNENIKQSWKDSWLTAYLNNKSVKIASNQESFTRQVKFREENQGNYHSPIFKLWY